jgi:hypothetical protein
MGGLRRGRGGRFVRLLEMLNVRMEDCVHPGGPYGMEFVDGVRHDLPGFGRQDGILKLRNEREGKEGEHQAEEEALERSQDAPQVPVPVVELPLLDHLSVPEGGHVDREADGDIKNGDGDESVKRRRGPEEGSHRGRERKRDHESGQKRRDSRDLPGEPLPGPQKHARQDDQDGNQVQNHS